MMILWQQRDGVDGFGDTARAQPAVGVERGRRFAAELHRVAGRGADAAVDAAAAGRGASSVRGGAGHATHRRQRAAPLVRGAAAAAQEEHALRPDDQGHQNAPHPTAAAGTADAPQVTLLKFKILFIFGFILDRGVDRATATSGAARSATRTRTARPPSTWAPATSNSV